MSFLTPCLVAQNLIRFQKEVAVQKKDAESKDPLWRSFINSTAGTRKESKDEVSVLSDKRRCLGVRRNGKS